MDFFEHQANARRKTGWLIAWFALAVISIIILVYALLSFFLLDGKWDPDAFGLVSCGVTLIVLGGSWFKTLELGRGGSIVAQSLGGHKVSSVTKDPGERRLLNVVEEMALASGVPVPEVYILGEEGGINAFAAGLSVNNAVIGVTRGCVEKLSRDELQGVIAHEFSHILNGDMRMNLNLMGWIYGILCLSIIGRILMRMRSGSRREKNNVLPLVGLGLFMIGHVGVIFARLIKSAVSRQREFLADASAVQFTRNPGGIAGALKKIGSTIGGSRLVSEAAEESSHLLFGNGLSESWIGLFSTHPPLDERIRRIDSSFRGKMSYDRPVGAAGSVSMDSLSSLSPQVSANTAAGISEEKALGDVGSLSEAHLDYAHELHENIPAALMEAARTSPGACSLVYSLLLSSDATAQSSQLGVIPKEFRGETLRLRNLIHDLDERVRMALINLSLDGLRSMSEGQYSEFQKVIFGMITSDDRVDLFEYCLHKIITEHLNAYFRKDESAVPARFYSIKPILEDCVVVIAMLAKRGHHDLGEILKAFSQGIGCLDIGDSSLTYQEHDLIQFDHALDQVVQASMPIKKKVLTACARTVAADGVIQSGEAELLRAIAETLGCPIPPFISQMKSNPLPRENLEAKGSAV